MSEIKVYKTELTPQRNALVDDLDKYLNTCAFSYENNDFQQRKIELNMSFKLTMPDDIYEPQSIGNYVKLSQLSKTYYLFINSYNWLSKNCIQINCSIDTINTFRNDVVWDDKTNVIREHRDRFDKIDEVYTSEKFQEIYDITGSFSDHFVLSDSRFNNTSVTNLTVVPDVLLGDVNVSITAWSVSEGHIDITILSEVTKLVNNRCDFKITFKVDLFGIATKIDKVPEGINPELYGKNEGDILDNEDNESWYVIYKSQKLEDPTNPGEGIPVQTFICKDSGFTASISSTTEKTITYNPSELSAGTYYCSTVPENITILAYDADDQEIYRSKTVTQKLYDMTNTTDSILVFYKNGDKIDYYTVSSYLKQIGHGSPPAFITERVEAKTISSIKIEGSYNFNIYSSASNPFPKVGNVNKIYNSTKNSILSSPSKEIGGSDTTVYIDSFDKVDKTQSTLIKIIKFPYCPVDYNIINNNYHFNSLIGSIKETTLKATLLTVPEDKGIKFGNKLKTTIFNPLKQAHELIYINATGDEFKDIKYESKLYNSEFYLPKVVYDSFSKSFDLEKISRNTSQSNTLNIEYKPSRIFNSSFLLKFPEYYTYDYDEQDYNNILICSRNNEMPIYNNAYLNYVRNGYNYDVKNKYQQNKMNWIGTGLSAIGTVAGAVTGQAFAAASFAVSTVGSITKNIEANKQAGRQIEQKLANAQAQATSVSNCDDIDLLEAYSNNKAKLMLYKVSDKVKRDIYDLFYYTGYRCDNFKLPDFNTRYWFNFIQCEPTFKEHSNYENFTDDMKARYAQGVTVYHVHNGEYDWDQNKENWETWMLGE